MKRRGRERKRKESSVDLTREERHELKKNSLTMPGAVVNNNEVGSAFLPCVLFRDAGWVVHGGNKREKTRERKMPLSLLATANKYSRPKREITSQRGL